MITPNKINNNPKHPLTFYHVQISLIISKMSFCGWFVKICKRPTHYLIFIFLKSETFLEKNLCCILIQEMGHVSG